MKTKNYLEKVASQKAYFLKILKWQKYSKKQLPFCENMLQVKIMLSTKRHKSLCYKRRYKRVNALFQNYISNKKMLLKLKATYTIKSEQ